MDALIAMYNEEQEKKKAEEEKKRLAEEKKKGNTDISNSGNNNNNNAQSKAKKYKVTYTIYDERGRKTNLGGYGIGDSIAAAQNAARQKAAGKTHGSKYYSVSYGKPTAYISGGYDYNTGLAMLHGTPTKPEAVLNPTQTKILRENILGNKPNSLINLLQSYNNAYKGLSSSTYDSISNNSNITTIERAEVNLNIDKLANDYDSKRAANTIMNEMLRIASKTSANNSVRG